MHTASLGGLTCVIHNPAGELPPDAVAVFCHGFGAPGTDLVPLGDEIASRLNDTQRRVMFVFPSGPLSLDREGLPGGRAWWPIDMVRLQRAIATGDLPSLRGESPPLLADMREHLKELLHEVREQTGLPLSRLLLGGFSQGAMLATDVALHLPTSPGGLVIWSGNLIAEQEWRQSAARLPRMRVVQSHAIDDPILPYRGAEALRDVLVEAGHDVKFLPFRGGHMIPGAAVQAAAELMDSILRQSPAA